jgi:tRNA A-37 threonylcarbamoyl transferase component Bud32
MNEFTTTLTAFLAGGAEFSQLEAALTRSLEADPSTAGAAFAEIDRIYKGGRLPLQLYVLLKNRIAQSHATAARRPAPPPAPPSPPPAPPIPPPRAVEEPRPAEPPPSAERTIMRSRPPPRPAADVSAPRPAPPPDPTGGFVPLSSTDTGRTGAPVTNRTGTGTGAGSSWSDPAKWTGQPAPTLERGSVLKERYVLESVIGRGGMGVVFKAKDLLYEEMQDRNPYVAIKILNEEFRRHPESLKALQREARKSQTLAHPNIVNVYGFDRDGGAVYMAMEFLEGEALDRIIKNAKFEGYSLEEAFPIIQGLANALSYAHKSGIVHSDFKPGNCFLTKNGVVKVFDFGIAQAAKLAGHQTGEVTKFDPASLGALTPAYASCEMIDGEVPDPRDDIYAFGCVVYELLTSKHPFNKKSAAEARDNKPKPLVPARVKNLTTRQWRALEKSLAFRRADRAATVDDVVAGLAKQPFNPTRIAIGVAAALLLSVGGYFGFLQYQTQQTEQLIAALESRDDARVPEAVERLRALGDVERNTVLVRVRDPLIAWYVGRATAAVDESQGRYGFPEAKRTLEEVEGWYPGLAVIRDERITVEQREKDLLADLDGRFNESLEAGRLIADDNADDIPEILAILRQIEADHALLTDPRLPLRYVDQATAALTREDLGAAGELIELGLAQFPSDGQLLNLRDNLSAARQSQANAVRIAELGQQLATAPGLRALADLRGLESPAVELAALAPDDSALRAYRDSLTAAIGVEVGTLLAARDWDGAQQLVDGSSNVLPAEYQREPRNRIATARQQYDAQRNALLARLDGAATAGQVNDARAAFSDLETFGADADTLQQARTAVLGGYANLVQRHVDANALDDANAAIDAGLAFDPSSQRLQQLRTAIGEQERLASERGREAAEQQRAAEAETLRTQIRTALAANPLSTGAAEQALNAVDQLSLRAPGDALGGAAGREQVAAKLAAQALALGRGGEWERAVADINGALKLIAESASLKTALDSAQTGLAGARAGAQQQRLAQQRQAVDALLSAPRYDAAWVREVREALTALGGLVPDGDPALPQAQQRAAELLVARGSEMRTQERFDEADRLLGFAATFTPQNAALQTEQQRLRDARSTWEAANASKAEEARIDGLKQTFLARANANDVRAADTALADLRRALPQTDAFLTTTAPQAITALYVRQAETRLNAQDFARADELVAAGLGREPRAAALLELQGKIRTGREQAVQRDLDALSTQLGSGAGNADTGRALLEAIQRNDPTGFAQREQDLIARATARVTANPADAPYRSYVNAIFRREIGPPVAAAAVVTPPVAPPAAPAPSSAPASPAASAAGRTCTPQFAGQGGRAAGVCFDALREGGRGPDLVVVGTGAGITLFAIARSELSIASWNTYCRITTACTPLAGADELPATNITAAAADAYTKWLTAQTGATYRLPTIDEWRHAALSPDQGQQQTHNCGRGGTLRSVLAGSRNAFGVADYYGNVQEWVTTPSGLQVTGGHFRQPLARCREDRVEPHDGSADDTTGIRLVRELAGG